MYIIIVCVVLFCNTALANSIDDAMKARACDGVYFIEEPDNKDTLPNTPIADNVAASYLIHDFGWEKYLRLCLRKHTSNSIEHESLVLKSLIKDEDSYPPGVITSLKEVIHIHSMTLKQRYRGKGVPPAVLYSKLFKSDIVTQFTMINLIRNGKSLSEYGKFKDIFELSKHYSEVQYALSSWLYRQQYMFTPIVDGKSPLPIDFDDYTSTYNGVVISPVLNHELILITSKTGELTSAEIVGLFEMILNKYPANTVTITKGRIKIFYNNAIKGVQRE